MTRTERTYYLVFGLYNVSWSFLGPMYALFLLSRGLDLFQINLVLAVYLITAFVFEGSGELGQVENYLVEQLRAFQAGERHNEMMSLVAPQLTPQDIDDLAAYYAAIPITVGKPPGQ